MTALRHRVQVLGQVAADAAALADGLDMVVPHCRASNDEPVMSAYEQSDRTV